MQRIFLKKSRTKKDRLCWCEMTEFLYTKAYPKVNVALKICERKKKLHTISSRFVLAMGNLYDEILFFKTQTLSNINSHYHTSFIFEEYCAINPHYKICILGNFNCDLESNLIYKAYVILHKQSLHSSTLSSQKTDAIKSLSPHINTIQQQYIVIAVKKSIPIGGGLGGGSANAAISLLVFNEILRFHYSIETLLILARELGSDIPFFVVIYSQKKAKLHSFFCYSCYTRPDLLLQVLELFYHTDSFNNIKNIEKNRYDMNALFRLSFVSANIFGIGDIVKPFVENILPLQIHCNNISCDTAKVYAAYDNLQQINCHKVPIDFTLDSKTLLSLYNIEQLNDLYNAACKIYPNLVQIYKELANQYGNIYFSGSGSSFFSLIS